MNTGMIEGLIGAGNSIQHASISMKVFAEARRKGDEATMNRALGYAINSTKQAEKYSKKLEEATKEDQKENSQKIEAEQTEALAKDKIEKKIENEIKKEELYHNITPERVDSVQISQEAEQYIEQQVKLVVKTTINKTYLLTGEIQTIPDTDSSEINMIV